VRARALVSRVYQLPEGERDAYLKQACEDDGALREEVAWLLEVLRGPEDEFLERGPDGAGVRENDELHVAKPHDYTLGRQLGEGGMGVVYLAERVEGEFRQTVALKLLNTSALASHTILSRFLFERQLLARLNHPNIAHLVDAGALGDGRPFLAMEYVDGIRIDTYCESHALSLAQRLQLFMKVCAALQYAHEQLVIHRDIKPANILVTANGEPKLLDFGIARQLASPATELTSTAGGQRIMTLAYASPEQVEGRALSTATDVYSLAVVLYELLTGTHPWGDTSNPAEVVQLVSRSDPLPPSVARRKHLEKTRTEPQRRHWIKRWPLGDLPRDLDAIVLKALSRHPGDRYSSPRALADDLQRFLDDRPVRARRGHQGYRLRKFVRRNRWPLAAAATIVLLIGAFAVNRQLQLQRTLAEQAKTAQVRDFMVELFESSQLEQTQGKNLSAREILDRGMARIERSLGSDATTQSALLQAMASAYHSLGVRDKAGPAAERALALARKDPTTSKATLAGLLLMLAEIHANDQNAVEQERYAREALAVALSDERADLASAVARKHIANALTKQAKPRSEVEPYFFRAIDELRRVEPEGEDYMYALQDYGVALRLWDSAKEALSQLTLARELATTKYGESDPRTVQIAAEYGLALERSGDPIGAENVLRRAYEQQVRLYGPDNPATAYVRGYLAFSLMSQRRFADAEPLLRETMEMGRKNDAVGNSTFNDTMNLGYALRELKRFQEAESLYREALAMVPAAFPPDRHEVMRATVHTYLGMTLQGQGRNVQAQTMLRQALVDLPNVDETKRTRASAWRGLAAAALAQGDTRAAEAASREALALYDPDTWWRADASVDVAEALVAQSRHRDAEVLLLEALQMFDREFPAGDPRTLRAARILVAAYEREGMGDRADGIRQRYALVAVQP
jgi:serine/threonine-protein kinase